MTSNYKMRIPKPGFQWDRPAFNKGDDMLLVKLPKTKCSNIPWMVPISDIKCISIHETRNDSADPWRVTLDDEMLSKRSAFFPTRESAEAWADDVAKLVNAATAGDLSDQIAKLTQQLEAKMLRRQLREKTLVTEYQSNLSDHPVMTSDGYLWWKDCAWEQRPAFRPKEPPVFRCPKCGGDHFRSISNRHSMVPHTYVCHGHESYNLNEAEKPPCGWRGPYSECFVNPAVPGTQAHIQQTIDKYFEPASGSNGGAAGSAGGCADYSTDSSTSPAHLLFNEITPDCFEFRIQFDNGRGGDFIRLNKQGLTKIQELINSRFGGTFADWQPTPEQMRDAAASPFLSDFHTDVSGAGLWLRAWQRVFAKQGEKR